MYDQNKVRQQIHKKIAARKDANMRLLETLKFYLESHDEIRFGQALVNLGIIQYRNNTYDEEIMVLDPFYEESIDMLNRIKS